MKKVILCGLLLTATIIGSGCIPLLVAGGAGIREITDKSVVYQGNIKSIDSAVKKAMKNLGAVIKEVVAETGEKGNRTIRGKTYDGEALTIDMEPTSPKSVNVEVRVGRIGSKDRAIEFHKEIQKYAKAITD